jgi:hypothetical protein
MQLRLRHALHSYPNATLGYLRWREENLLARLSEVRAKLAAPGCTARGEGHLHGIEQLLQEDLSQLRAYLTARVRRPRARVYPA